MSKGWIGHKGVDDTIPGTNSEWLTELTEDEKGLTIDQTRVLSTFPEKEWARPR